MSDQITFQPNWSSSPGNTIYDILEEKNISLKHFADCMNSTMDFVERLINGQVSINNEIAEKLEINLGSTIDFWVKREEQYRESIERIQESEKLWLKELPIKDMIKFGWIEKSDDLLNTCLNFFKVPNISSWKAKYPNEINTLAFRTSQSFNSYEAATATWLRQGEIITENIECKSWNKELFEETLVEIKKLTRLKNPKDFIPKLISLCSNCGVAVGIVPTPTGCRASGATKFVSKDKAILLLSFRYLSDDQFWFTFFHEAGHLILHNKKSIHLEINDKDNRIVNEEETEANAFAAEILMPYMLHDKLRNIRGNMKKIISLAIEAGVSPGIVVGQLQYLGYIDFKYLNGYKRRYNWDEIKSIKTLKH